MTPTLGEKPGGRSAGAPRRRIHSFGRRLDRKVPAVHERRLPAMRLQGQLGREGDRRCGVLRRADETGWRIARSNYFGTIPCGNHSEPALRRTPVPPSHLGWVASKAAAVQRTARRRVRARHGVGTHDGTRRPWRGETAWTRRQRSVGAKRGPGKQSGMPAGPQRRRGRDNRCATLWYDSRCAMYPTIADGHRHRAAASGRPLATREW